jgi:hypothetical protein
VPQLFGRRFTVGPTIKNLASSPHSTSYPLLRYLLAEEIFPTTNSDTILFFQIPSALHSAPTLCLQWPRGLGHKRKVLSRADLPAPRHLLRPPAAHLLDHFPALPHCSALRSDFPAPCSIPLTPLIYFPPLPTALRHLSNTPTSCLRLSRSFADLLDRSAHRSDFPAVHFLFLYLSSCSPTLPITCRSSPALRPHSSDFPTTSPTALSALSRRSDFPAVHFRHNNHSPTTLSFILLFHTLYYCS